MKTLFPTPISIRFAILALLVAATPFCSPAGKINAQSGSLATPPTPAPLIGAMDDANDAEDEDSDETASPTMPPDSEFPSQAESAPAAEFPGEPREGAGPTRLNPSV